MVIACSSTGNWTSRAFSQKLKPSSLLSSYLRSMSACSFKTRLIPFHNTPLWLLCTSINYNGPHNKHLQFLISAYLSNIKCPLWLQCYKHLLLSMVVAHHNFTHCVSTGHISVEHSPSLYILWSLDTTYHITEKVPMYYKLVIYA